MKKILFLPYNPKLKDRAKELRKAGNLSEALLWNQFKNKKLNGLSFDRQRVIGNYIVDFFCFDKNLVIEIDGSSHDNKVEYDNDRDIFLKGLGLKVLRIKDSDVRKNMDYVLRLILET